MIVGMSRRGREGSSMFLMVLASSNLGRLNISIDICTCPEIHLTAVMNDECDEW